MKPNDPAKVFTCVSCKRVRPKGQRERGRNRCRDRKGCTEATVVWLSQERFVVGATARW